jgi:hypothetical protein
MDPITKAISATTAAEFDGKGRFNDELMSEWHIISTNQPDHIGDIMEYDGMELPPSGKAIALLNHDPFWTGGLPLGIVLEYRRVKVGEVEQLWQHTQYLKNLPDDIGTMTYQARKLRAFTDSSIQFFAAEGGILPVHDDDLGKSRWDWKGTRYKKWSLVEAGPVLMGMNWDTGAMKTATAKDINAAKSAMLDTLKAALGEQPTRILPEKRLGFIAGSDRPIPIIH